VTTATITATRSSSLHKFGLIFILVVTTIPDGRIALDHSGFSRSANVRTYMNRRPAVPYGSVGCYATLSVALRERLAETHTEREPACRPGADWLLICEGRAFILLSVQIHRKVLIPWFGGVEWLSG
jgi:hypothetical protein